VRERSREMILVLTAVQSNERDVPQYISADHKKMSATFVRVPQLTDIPYPVTMEPHLVVEFYSR
jgi:small subunit ribosomal protein S4